MKDKRFDVLKDYEVDFDQKGSWKLISSRLKAPYSFWKFNFLSFNIYYCIVGLAILGACSYYFINNNPDKEITSITTVAKKDSIVIQNGTTSGATEEENSSDVPNNPGTQPKNSLEESHSSQNRSIQTTNDTKTKPDGEKEVSGKLEKTDSQTDKAANFTNLHADSALKTGKEQLKSDQLVIEKNAPAVVKKDSILAPAKKRIYVTRKDTIYKNDTVYKKPIFRKR